MVLVVQVGDGLAERADTGGGAVLAAGHGNVERLRALEAAFDIVFDLGGTLAQVGPLLGLLEEAKLGSTLRAPDDTSGSARGVKAGVGQVALVCGAELAMDLAASL